ncbi:MAG: hypothetical protein EPN45_20470 [Rhizobiaceae bacterium]|nr:MAG: hypothetical protein EPN45_20470 [Rhizobiaceae bacterium]
MNAPGEEDFARAINRGFDTLVERQRAAGTAEAVQLAQAAAFAAVAFVDQAAGRSTTLALIDDLIRA